MHRRRALGFCQKHLKKKSYHQQTLECQCIYNCTALSIIYSIVTCIPTCFYQVSESAQESAYVGVTANNVSSSALEAAEKLGLDLANALINKGAKDILTTARKLNDAR